MHICCAACYIGLLSYRVPTPILWVSWVGLQIRGEITRIRVRIFIRTTQILFNWSCIFLEVKYDYLLEAWGPRCHRRYMYRPTSMTWRSRWPAYTPYSCIRTVCACSWSRGGRRPAPPSRRRGWPARCRTRCGGSTPCRCCPIPSSQTCCRCRTGCSPQCSSRTRSRPGTGSDPAHPDYKIKPEIT